MALQEENNVPQINYNFLFHVIPDPVIIIDKNGRLVELNITATDEFASISIGDKFENLFSDKRKIKNTLLELFRFHKVIIDKAIVKTKKSDIQTFEFKATILSESNELYLFIFNNLASKNDLIKLEIDHAFSTEINELKPYLNKTGKELVEKKITDNKLTQIFESEVKSHQPTNLIDLNQLNKISSVYPNFSNNEQKIAYFLSIEASINQIATITGKTANTIRVMIHRMKSKANVNSTSELAKCIKKINFLILMLLIASQTLIAQKGNSLFSIKKNKIWETVLNDKSIAPAQVFLMTDNLLTVGTSTNGYIRTKKKYQNYCLQIDWRWTKKPGNSGVLLHIQDKDSIWPKCFQVQQKAEAAGDIICMNGLMASECTDTVKFTIPKLNPSNEKPTGEWNVLKVISLNGTLTIYVNGLLQNKASGLTKTKGYIGFQAEGREMEFRNLYLTKK